MTACTCNCGGTLCPACVQRLDSEHAEELDGLAEYAGLNLRLEHDPEAPMLWAVWGGDGWDEEEIIGAGDSPSEAIEDARQQIQRWDERESEKNSNAWMAHNREPSR